MKLLAITIFIALLPIFSISANQVACHFSDERKIIDSLLDHNYHQTNRHLDELMLDQGLIRSKSFYRWLAAWSQAVDTKNQKKIDLAISELEKIFSDLEFNYVQQKSADTLLEAGMVAAFIARIKLHHGSYHQGYQISKHAFRYLNAYTQHKKANYLGIITVRFIFGLRQIYLAKIPNQLKLLYGISIKEGNLDRGRYLLKQIIKTLHPYASEAARTLLMETPWDKPEICSYQSLAEQMAFTYLNNPIFPIISQAIYLRCGNPDKSLYIYYQFSDLYKETIEWDSLSMIGYYRGLADTQRVDLLAVPHDQHVELEPYRLLALANALDLKGERKQAITTYKKLLNFPQAPKAVMRSAKLRLNYLYSKPPYLPTDRTLILVSCPN